MGVQTATYTWFGPRVSGESLGQCIVSQVREWYEQTYGDRLKTFLGPGTMAILIRGDPWRVRFPLLFGNFVAACIPEPSSWRGPADAAVFNVFDDIEGFTAGLGRDLTDAECADILLAYTCGLEALQALRGLAHNKFIPEAIGDQQAAVVSIFADPPQYGASRWHSLQLVEKLFKCYIGSRGGKVSKHHRLRRHALDAGGLGLDVPDSSLLSAVQCNAGVRYGEVGSTLTQAIEAHQASLEICRLIAPQIGVCQSP